MDIQNLRVLPLHKHQEYLKACCGLINDEWPRSETARMLSLQASRDELPTSLVLVNDNNQLLGHCKLTPIPSIPESCFVETVVISRAMRGKKLGSFLMKYVEDYCRSRINLKMIHLSTKGQENFYEKLGYEVCAPVSIYGVGVPSNRINNTTEKNTNSQGSLVSSGHERLGPPPPPLPKNDISIPITLKSTKTFMFKYL